MVSSDVKPALLPERITDCQEIPETYILWRRLCEEDEQYRQLWFDGKGPGQPSRMIPERPTPRQQRERQKLNQEAFRRRMHEEATEDMHERLDRTLDHCFGGCKHFDDRTCTASGGRGCQMRRYWIERLLVYGCEIARTDERFVCKRCQAR